MDVDVKLQDVPVVLVLVEVQQVIGLPLDVIHNVGEVLDHLVQPIDVGVLGQGAELVDGREHVEQLLAALDEKVKLAKNAALVKGEDAAVPLLALQGRGEGSECGQRQLC